MATILETADARARAEALGLTALALMEGDRTRAIALLGDGLRSAILEPLDFGTEFLRIFLAAALSRTGDLEAAVAEAAAISEPETRLEALHAVRMALARPDPAALASVDAELSRLLQASDGFGFTEQIAEEAYAIQEQGVQPRKTRAELAAGVGNMLDQMLPLPPDRATREFVARGLGYASILQAVHHFGEIARVTDVGIRGLDRMRQLGEYLEPLKSIALLCDYAEAVGRSKPAEGESILRALLTAPQESRTAPHEGVSMGRWRPRRRRPSEPQQISNVAVIFAGAGAIRFVRSDLVAADRLTEHFLARLPAIDEGELEIMLPNIWQAWEVAGRRVNSLRSCEHLKHVLLLATRKSGSKVKASAVRALCASEDIEEAESILQAIAADEAYAPVGTLAAELKRARDWRELRKLRERTPSDPLKEIYFRGDSRLLMSLMTEEESGETDVRGVSILARALAQDHMIGSRGAILLVGVWGLLYPAYAQGGPAAVRAIIRSVESVDSHLAQMVSSPWWPDVAASPRYFDDSERPRRDRAPQ